MDAGVRQGSFSLYRKYRVAMKRESDDSHRVKKPCRAGCAPRGEEVSCEQHRSGAKNPAEPDSILETNIKKFEGEGIKGKKTVNTILEKQK